MPRANVPRPARSLDILPAVIGLLSLSLGGCAGDPPKPTSTVTPDQVRSHSDRGFERLKQEEQNRGADPAMPR